MTVLHMIAGAHDCVVDDSCVISSWDVGTMWDMTANDSRQSGDPFGSTHWSIVLAAGDERSIIARGALEQLCESYWYPVYAYVRRRSANADDAQDLTQGFFTHLLDKQTIAQADPGRGRFRAFLLTSVKNFLINEHEKAAAQKRGGDRRKLSMDFEAAESRYALEPSHNTTPERIFEQQWALTLLNRVLESLQQEYTAAGNADLFEHLKVFLTGQSSDVTHADVAAELGITEVASRAALSRLRKRYRELLTIEIAQTVSAADEVEEELQSLFVALGS